MARITIPARIFFKWTENGLHSPKLIEVKYLEHGITAYIFRCACGRRYEARKTKEGKWKNK